MKGVSIWLFKASSWAFTLLFLVAGLLHLAIFPGMTAWQNRHYQPPAISELEVSEGVAYVRERMTRSVRFADRWTEIEMGGQTYRCAYDGGHADSECAQIAGMNDALMKARVRLYWFSAPKGDALYRIELLSNDGSKSVRYYDFSEQYRLSHRAATQRALWISGAASLVGLGLITLFVRRRSKKAGAPAAR